MNDGTNWEHVAGFWKRDFDQAVLRLDVAEKENKKLKAALRLCEKALNGIKYCDAIEGDVFCEHAAPPCHKCDNCRAALAAIREMGVGDG